MNIDNHDPVVAFTLTRYPRQQRLRALAHLGLDRWPLAHTPGLLFWRLLGVGQGRVFDPHADLQRYALFTVWRSLDDLRRFESTSTVMQRIYQRSEESWTVHMVPVSWHGKWGGRDPLQGFVAASPPQTGPWLILTRATIHPTKVSSFLHAVPAVAEQLLRQKSLLQSVGVGEAPLFYQATLSIWSTLPAVQQFAYKPAAHMDVIRRTRQEQWYKEEMFARFRPLASYGTWDGIDPLARPIE
ncbi:hypothetical protein [Dictyobacter kobayashii]|uniref:Spheroidene monooxygenase n=1 Tax=Dictyobacter kobayashii TaxID=2014872 RepID=A0A402AB50_9CHLR|nr:hypothetical protein [Dictyobacter kobayashii]GCE16392.1 hypothetical protein KDK_01920 [Dictyobacter kobayashii]